MRPTSFLLLTVFLMTAVLTACRMSPPPVPPSADKSTISPANTVVQNPSSSASSTTGAIKIKAEVWTDNWSAFYLGDQLVMEDSIPITTERSFNKEVFTFKASYPLSLNFIVKDFKQNDTGLEYIGTNKQQMGDGGFIAQFTNADTGELIAVTDSNWKGLVIQEAPLDKACEKSSNPIAGQMPCGFTSLEEPTDWKDLNFDDSAWNKATIYTEQQVSPKDGYYEIKWNPSAKLIWGPDLETDNTILYRLTVAEMNR